MDPSLPNGYPLPPGPGISVWHPRAVCPGCGWHTYAPFGDVFHVPVACCPNCGQRKVTFREALFLGREKEWKVGPARWVSTAKLFHPTTWGTGPWEFKEEQEATPL